MYSSHFERLSIYVSEVFKWRKDNKKVVFLWISIVINARR